jgi:acyl carrier protein
MDSAFVDILRSHLKYLLPGQDLEVYAPLKSLGLDSMEAVSLMIDIEERFAVLLPDSALTADTFRSAASLWAAIEAARGPAAAQDSARAARS